MPALRRLISSSKVAEKLDMNLDYFYRCRKKLEQYGFPPPALGFGRLRYDEKAIDLWLDHQMQLNDSGIEFASDDEILEMRLRELC